MSGVHSLSTPMVGRSLTLRVAPAATPAMLHNAAAGVVPNAHAEGKVRLGFHGQVRLHSPWPGIVYKPCRCVLRSSPRRVHAGASSNFTSACHSVTVRLCPMICRDPDPGEYRLDRGPRSGQSTAPHHKAVRSQRREDAVRLFFSSLVAAIVAMPALADDVPRFQVDSTWPKPLPNDWIMGQAAGVAVDAQDHIWVIQRPRTLTDDEKGSRSIRRPPNAVARRPRSWSSTAKAP